MGATLLVAWLLTPVPRASYAEASPLLGSWKLDVARSTYRPGPPPRSNLLMYEAAGDGLKATSKGVDAEGRGTGAQFTAAFDGKDYPVMGSSDWDAVVLEHVDDRTIRQIRKRNGQVAQTATLVVSEDGKVLTVRVEGTNATGQPVSNVGIYIRQ